MIAKQQSESANYLCIVWALRDLRKAGKITEKEYARAKNYYKTLTGADIIITE